MYFHMYCHYLLNPFMQPLPIWWPSLTMSRDFKRFQLSRHCTVSNVHFQQTYLFEPHFFREHSVHRVVVEDALLREVWELVAVSSLGLLLGLTSAHRGSLSGLGGNGLGPQIQITVFLWHIVPFIEINCVCSRFFPGSRLARLCGNTSSLTLNCGYNGLKFSNGPSWLFSLIGISSTLK